MVPQSSAASSAFRPRRARDHRLRPGRPHEDAALAAELRVQALDLVADRSGQLPPRDADVLLRLRVAGITRRRIGERAALERAAEEQRGDEAVAGDVAVEVDQVPGLLAAEQPPSRRSASST